MQKTINIELTSSQKMLKTHQLRHTDCRQDVLATFIEAQFALAHSDLEKQFQQYDRVTLYRTLKTFLDKGLIHKVLDDEGTPKYALCHLECEEHHHHHDHIHFKCVVCGVTTCLNNLYIPVIELPKGYKILEMNFLVQGNCPNCSIS
jgi:Fur family transcriptional regulator, ferric uptake regulator